MINRKIIHVDMDAFYASVEQLDNSKLKGKPLAVGGSADRGVIAAASYEARKFGVKSAMSSKMAARMCPSLIFVKPNFVRYKEVSLKIHEIFKRYSDIIEPLALDEAFIDVTKNKLDLNSATFIAQSIKNDIFNELNLTASAGVSYNKFLAKMASDEDKPNGLFTIQPHEGKGYVEQLQIERFFGVGKVTAEKMHQLGIFYGRDLLKYTQSQLTDLFGKGGLFLYEIARGNDNREVIVDRERKSIASERTFEKDIFDSVTFINTAEKIALETWNRYQGYEKEGRSVSIKIKFNDFSQITRSTTIPKSIDHLELFTDLTNKLIQQVLPLIKPVRLIGFQLSSFNGENEDRQLEIEF